MNYRGLGSSHEFAEQKEGTPFTNRINVVLVDPIKENTNNLYPEVTIGEQVWMSTNLSVTHYRNGDPIPEVKEEKEFYSIKTGAWCWYNNDSLHYAKYGRLYNHYAVKDPRGLAPAGWHIPSNEEWLTLSRNIDSETVFKSLNHPDNGSRKAGFSMKAIEEGSLSKHSSNNSSGFNGLMGGKRYRVNANVGYAYFNYCGVAGSWWANNNRSSSNPDNLIYWELHAQDDGFFQFSEEYSNNALSIRCLRDKPAEH